MTNERIKTIQETITAFDNVKHITVHPLFSYMWADDEGKIHLDETFSFKTVNEEDASKLNRILHHVDELKEMNCKFNCDVSFDDDGYIFFHYNFDFSFGQYVWERNSVRITVMINTAK